ncbi:aquaporin [Aplysia californica]|uniref:Aquaporin n=1 Tax=Aplysia californica TaxID=6500 RepID=A0ABM1A098_APLCA|nr:aquaporin [Aplysia californica]
MSSKYENFPDHDSSGRNTFNMIVRDRRMIFQDFIRPCFAELMATALFVFLGTMPVLGMSVNRVAIANGMTITMVVIAFSPVSGCHINPVVTLALYLCGEIPTIRALCYVLTQLLGGMLGSMLLRSFLTEELFTLLKAGSQNFAPGVTVPQAFLCETTLTFMLIYVILTALMPEPGRHPLFLGPICIGFAVVIAVLAGSHVSGPSLNPARSFGPAVIASFYNMGSEVWDNHYVYWVGPISGTLLATLFFRLVYMSIHSCVSVV